MIQTSASIKAEFFLSPNFWKLFRDYCYRMEYSELYLHLGGVHKKVVHQIITGHVIGMIRIFSKKVKNRKQYIPYAVGTDAQFDKAFLEEFFQRICITQEGSEQFIEQLYEELLTYAKRFTQQEKTAIFWDPDIDAIIVASYDVPTPTFGEKYGLKGYPTCIGLLTRVENAILMA